MTQRKQASLPEEERENYVAAGLGIGICVGAALGSVFGRLTLGLVLGLCLGGLADLLSWRRGRTKTE